MPTKNPLNSFTTNEVMSPIARQGKDIMDAINDSEEGFTTYKSPYIYEKNRAILRDNKFHVVDMVSNDGDDIGISWTNDGTESLYNTLINKQNIPMSQYDRKIGKTGPTGDRGMNGKTGEKGETGDRGKKGEKGEKGDYIVEDLKRQFSFSKESR